MADSAPDSHQELEALRQQHTELGQRLSRLERQLGIGGKAPAAAALKAPSRLSGVGLEQLIGLQGFSWLGILALVTGLGLFIRYAFLEGWLGPLAILAGGALVGTGTILAGEWIARKVAYRTWAHALMGGGIAVLYFLVYAAYHFDYFRQVTHLNLLVDTLLLMAVVGLAIWLALRRRAQNLASRAFVLGFATSLLSHELAGLTLIYNLLLSIGLVGVAAICRWQSLGLLGVMGSYALHGLWLMANPDASLAGQAVLLIYFALYSLVIDRLEAAPVSNVSPTEVLNPDRLLPVFWRRSQALALVNLLGFAGWSGYLQTRVGLAAGLLALLVWFGLGLLQQARLLSRQVGRDWQLVFCLHWWTAAGLGQLLLVSQQQSVHLQALVLLSWAAGAVAWRLRLRIWRPAWLQAGCAWLAAACLAGGLALEAPAHSLGLLWAAEALGLLWLGQRRAEWIPAAWLLVMATMLQLGLQEFPAVYPLQPWLQPLIALHGLAVALLLVMAWRGEACGPTVLRHGFNWPAGLTLTLWLAGALPAEMLSLGWALAGCGLVIAGFGLSHRLLRLQGLCLLLLTGSKVFALDLRFLAMGWRILSLVVLGGLLLGIALLYTRRQHAAAEADSTLTNEGQT